MLGSGTTETVGSLVLDPKPEDEAGPLLLGIGTDELEGVMLAEDEGTKLEETAAELDSVTPEPPVSVGVGSAVGAAVSIDGQYQSHGMDECKGHTTVTVSVTLTVTVAGLQPSCPPWCPSSCPPWLPGEPFEPLDSLGGTTTV